MTTTSPRKAAVTAKEREVDRSFRVVSSMVNFVGTDVVTFRADERDDRRSQCVAELSLLTG